MSGNGHGAGGVVGGPSGELPARALAPFIQHTLISAGVTREEILTHARETAAYGFAAAMVPASWCAVVVAELAGTGIPVASALDFPTVGVMTSRGKAAEAAEIARLGAAEIDIGVQVGWLRSGLHREFRDDIAGVVAAAGIPIKVMLELPLLTPAERDLAVELACEAGAAWLKNASSQRVGVADPASVAYLVARAAGRARVKASGGIATADQARALLAAGADLLGTSAGIAIVTDTAGAAAY